LCEQACVAGYNKCIIPCEQGGEICLHF
jgi:hypothetical protein